MRFFKSCVRIIDMIKRPRISKEEIIADILYLFVAMLVSAIAIYVFDIHWSFYPGETIFPPSKNIFKDPIVYYIGVPVGGILGFFILKLIFFAFMEEKIAHDGNELVIKVKKGRAYAGKK